jgi:hypothetical protein
VFQRPFCSCLLHPPSKIGARARGSTVKIDEDDISGVCRFSWQNHVVHDVGGAVCLSVDTPVCVRACR